MGSERPARAEVGHPELVTAERPDRRGTTGSHVSWFTTALMLGLIGWLGFVLMTGEVTPTDRSPRPGRDPSSTIGKATSATAVARSGLNIRVIDRFEAPVLEVLTGAIAISTDFDGRITALELDSGVVTRTSIRTGAFVTVDGELVVQTGCGAWRTVKIPEYTLGHDLIGCGSYQPIGQRGADVVFFARPDPDGVGVRDVLISDGDGGVLAATVAEAATGAYATVSDGRVLIQGPDSELVWVQTGSGESTHYARGTLIESGPGGVLWADCETSTTCEVWFGTPEQARVNRFAIQSRGGEFLARINDGGSRAVFFLEDEILRIVTLETGHAREVENPGIHWSTATWSPDGLWLLGPKGTDVVALNTLNGRTIRFDGQPGDVSPGWVALIEGP